MAKRGSGPGGPDHAAEPFETETPDAAPEHHNGGCGCAQHNGKFLSAQCGDALGAIPEDRVVYDSGWEEGTGLAVRVVFAAGGENPELWRWVRRLAFQQGTPEDPGG